MRKLERVLLREQRARQRTIAILRWVMHTLHHVSLLSLMAEQSSCGLVLVDKGELAASLVEQHLVNHPIRTARIDHSTVENGEPGDDHDRQHDRICSIEWVLLDQEAKYD